MGKTVAAFTMSLDGFIAGPNDEVGRLFKWYGSGNTNFTVPGTEMTLRRSNIKRGNQTIIQMLEELNDEKSYCA